MIKKPNTKKKFAGKPTKNSENDNFSLPAKTRFKFKGRIIENNEEGNMNTAPPITDKILEPLKEENAHIPLQEDDEKFEKFRGTGYLSHNEVDKKNVEQEKNQTTKILETLDFKNGEDIVKIVLSQKSNRTYRIQIFLNEITELRPVTYAGSCPAMAYWNLLKRSLKKGENDEN